MLKLARTEPDATSVGDARRGAGPTRVWDPLDRVLHWTLVLNFGIAWLTSHSSEKAHQWAGYYAAVVVLVRVLWGFLGTPYARFSEFVRNPATVARYLYAIVRGREARTTSTARARRQSTETKRRQRALQSPRESPEHSGRRAATSAISTPAQLQRD
jgi:hypothetical protein